MLSGSGFIFGVLDVEKVIVVFAVKKMCRLGFFFAADPDIEAHSDNE